MQIKRKRSDSEISTTSSLLSSPSSGHAMSMNVDSMDAQINTPALFASRTRKRHRDNRPDENIIHRTLLLRSHSTIKLTCYAENTLSLLFSAQQSSHNEGQSHVQPINLPPPAFQNLANTPVIPSPNQSSLHSFWTLPKQRSFSSPSSIDSSNASTPNSTPTPNHMSYFQPSNCEDCDASLNGSGGDAMDVDQMDVDMVIGGENYGCSSCGKQVCRQCAVSNLGAERRCLGCAGQGQRGKMWEGGIGWVDAY